jgi:hypothetical protein
MGLGLAILVAVSDNIVWSISNTAKSSKKKSIQDGTTMAGQET